MNDKQTLRFDYALKIAQYLGLYLGISRRAALEFAFNQERTFTYEYGFGGTLKFWINAGRWYVVSYLENPTKERETMITMVNVKLASLKERFEKGKPAWLIEEDTSVLRQAAKEELEGFYKPRARQVMGICPL